MTYVVKLQTTWKVFCIKPIIFKCVRLLKFHIPNFSSYSKLSRMLPRKAHHNFPQTGPFSENLRRTYENPKQTFFKAYYSAFTFSGVSEFV